MNGEIFRGQVYFTDLGQRTGSEQSGMRPVIIVQNDIGNRNSPTVIVVPITSQIKREDMPTHISLSKSFGLDEDSNKDIMFEFPAASSQTKTVLVLKTPKTESSVRKIYLPGSTAEMLISWKAAQEEGKNVLGAEYKDYNLVFAGTFGAPTEGTSINAAFSRLIKEHDLPPVVFHSFRHSSITYKLKLTGGDFKAVQGDSGHAQAKMVSDVYSHIIDDDRKTTAQLFEKAFYSNTGFQQKPLTDDKPADTSDQALLQKIMSSPEMASLLVSLAKEMKI